MSKHYTEPSKDDISTPMFLGILILAAMTGAAGYLMGRDHGLRAAPEYVQYEAEKDARR